MCVLLKSVRGGAVCGMSTSGAVCMKTTVRPVEISVVVPVKDEVENVAPLAVWLASLEARDVTGRVFEVKGGRIAVAEGWRIGPEIDIGRCWEAAALSAPVAELLSRAQGNRDVSGRA